VGRAERSAIATNNGKNNPPVLWCLKDVANFYSVHISSVHRWDREGYFPKAYKGFGSRRWMREEVIEALRNVRRTPDED